MSPAPNGWSTGQTTASHALPFFLLQMLREATVAYTPAKPGGVASSKAGPPRRPPTQGRQKRCSSPPPPGRGLRHLLGSGGHAWRRGRPTPDTAQQPAEGTQPDIGADASRELWVVRRRNSHAEQQQRQRQRLPGGLLAGAGHTVRQHPGAGWLHAGGLGGSHEPRPAHSHGKAGGGGLPEALGSTVVLVVAALPPAMQHNAASVRPMLARAHVCRAEVGLLGSKRSCGWTMGFQGLGFSLLLRTHGQSRRSRRGTHPSTWCVQASLASSGRHVQGAVRAQKPAWTVTRLCGYAWV